MTIKEKIKNLIEKILEENKIHPQKISSFKVDFTQEGFGDLATNIAFVVFPFLGKKFKNPTKLAEFLTKEIEKAKEAEIFEKIEVAGRGFINFTFSREFIFEKLAQILKEKENFGRLHLGKGKKIQIEFISANPTGPLTLGNGRGGFWGDSLARLLEFSGFEVEKEYFVNNLGRQIEILGYSILDELEYLKIEEKYKGAHIKEIAQKMKKKIDFENALPLQIGQIASEIILEDYIKKTIKNMGIYFDSFVYETELYDKQYDIEILDLLKKKNFIYEKDGAVFFLSSNFGDEKDRVLYRSNGLPTYFASDCAYHYYKFAIKKYDKVINLWGADHHGYVKRMKAATKALGFDEEKLKIIVFQLVRLIEEGKEVKMSKRRGQFITLDDILAEIPLNVVRFFFLMFAPQTHMDFDLKLAKEKSLKNPVFYFQYAYVRALSIFKKAPSFKLLKPDFSLLSSEAEIALAKELIKFPDLILKTASDYQIHQLVDWGLILAKKFHNFYEKEKVIFKEKEKAKLMESRLALVKATTYVFKNLAQILGISLPQKM